MLRNVVQLNLNVAPVALVVPIVKQAAAALDGRAHEMLQVPGRFRRACDAERP
jgi:hypothetical protein